MEKQYLAERLLKQFRNENDKQWLKPSGIPTKYREIFHEFRDNLNYDPDWSMTYDCVSLMSDGYNEYDLEAPVYWVDLLDWLCKSNNQQFVDEALEQGAKNLFDALQAGYMIELQAHWCAIESAMENSGLL